MHQASTSGVCLSVCLSVAPDVCFRHVGAAAGADDSEHAVGRDQELQRVSSAQERRLVARAGQLVDGTAAGHDVVRQDASYQLCPVQHIPVSTLPASHLKTGGPMTEQP
jgi:hypothetical protein